MIKKISLSFATIILVFLISLPLTRYKLDESIHPVSVPDSISELDSYLTHIESRLGDVVEGTEKKIFWANGKPEQTEYAIVYIHGYSSSRPETAPLGERIAQELKANIYYTRLAGHGRTSEAFSKVNANEWLHDTVEAFEIGKRIGKKVILMGASTGCTLIIWLLNQEKYQKDATAAVFISPNFFPHTKMTKLFSYPAGVEFAKLVYGKERSWEPKNEQMKKYWTYKYNWEAITPMIVLVEHIQNFSFNNINTPILFLYTEQDKVIDPNEIVDKFPLFGSKDKKLVNLKQVKDHIMAGDIISPNFTDLVYGEIISYLNQIGIQAVVEKKKK